MAEKLAEVYEQYDMDIVSTRKGRGATILTTSDGYRILEPFRGNITRLEQEHVLKKLLLEDGFSKVDAIIPNRDGQLLTCDKYRQPFVLKQHFDGEECGMKNISDVKRSVRALTNLHICGKAAASRFQTAWEQYEHEKEEKKFSEIRKAFADGEELERIAHVYDIRETVLDEILKGPCAKDGTKEPGAQKKNETKMPDMVYKDINEIFIRHNKELKKIYRFINTVKQKNAFENLFLKVFWDYYGQGIDCVKMLEDKNITKQVYDKHYGICHGNYNQHNVLLCEDGEAIVHFERFSKGNQLNDLYQFSRKVMEKNNFDLTLLEAILKEYNKKISLEREDYRYIYILFSYPEKFWKIANGYYNTNKAFLSPKYVEKLETVILQEKEKRDMLNKFSAFHLLDM
ncbi:MAG: hypothetical protein K2I10_12715 [Lachnospiraceae bacterium]|nr:hypothetical protein [Lachnospiraceae bacterium]